MRILFLTQVLNVALPSVTASVRSSVRSAAIRR